MEVIWSVHRSYNETEVQEHVPNEAGVYLLWIDYGNGERGDCFYVGQADNLKERLLEHLSDSESNDCVKHYVSNCVCGFEYAKIPNKRHRNGVERFLYDHYDQPNPSDTRLCNQNKPSEESIEINLPQ